MSEFQLEMGTIEAATRYMALDDFTKGYVEAMFFCGLASDEHRFDALHLGMLSDEAWKTIEDDCTAFEVGNAAVLAAATSEPKPRKGERYAYDMKRAGHDYWFTRNEHGAGYSDRNLPADVEEELERAATAAGVQDLCVGDDGSLHL